MPTGAETRLETRRRRLAHVCRGCFPSGISPGDCVVPPWPGAMCSRLLRPQSHPGVPAWKLTNGGRMLPPSGSVENCLARASRKLFGVTVDGNSQCGETTKGQGRVRGSMKPGFQDRGACFCPPVAVRSPLQSVSLSRSPALGAPPLLISPAPQLRDMLGWGRSGWGPGMLVSRWT